MSHAFSTTALVAVAFVLPTSAMAATLPVAGFTGGDIQTAINNAAAGDTVQLGAGQYILNTPLNLKTGVSLWGASQHDTTLVYRGLHTTNAPAIIEIEDANNVTLRHFTLDGETRTQGASSGITVGHGNNLHFENLGIQNLAGPTDFGPIGIYFFEEVHHASVTDSTFSHIGTTHTFGSGVRVHGNSDDNLIANNHFDHTGRGGIFGKGNGPTQGPDRLVIRNNTITHSGMAFANAGPNDDVNALGIEIQNFVNDAVIENNTLDRWLSVDNSNRAAVRNNTITGALGDAGVASPNGIEVIDAQNIIVTGNTVAGASHYGLSIAGEGGTHQGLFANNTFTGAGQFGVQLQGNNDNSTEKLYFAHNDFTGSASDAARLNISAQHVVFDDNTLDAANDFSLALSREANDPGFTDIVITNNIAPDGFDDESPSALTFENRGTVNEQVFAQGDPITLVLDPSDPALSHLNDIASVLWDLGPGSITNATGSATLATTALLPGTYQAVVWDTTGNSALIPIRVLPEPAALALFLPALLMGTARRRHATSRG
ncbi:MAG: right-handed parallel beta-helix repeat-containing protein [Algisphaera sp.]